MATEATDQPRKRGVIGKILLVALGLYQVIFIGGIIASLMAATLPAAEAETAAAAGPGVERIAMLVFFWVAGSGLLWYAVKKEEKVRAQLAG
jgi:hypothetical protein